MLGICLLLIVKTCGLSSDFGPFSQLEVGVLGIYHGKHVKADFSIHFSQACAAIEQIPCAWHLRSIARGQWKIPIILSLCCNMLPQTYQLSRIPMAQHVCYGEHGPYQPLPFHSNGLNNKSSRIFWQALKKSARSWRYS